MLRARYKILPETKIQAGYNTQGFELIALEIKMILAFKRAAPAPEKKHPFASLKAFYGIPSQHLETLTNSD